MSAVAARALVFFTSAAVLVLEILAGRLLAPYVGVTLETFTAIIGTVLAGISLGAWLGGRAADRHPPARLIGPLLIAGGLLALAAPTIVEVLGPTLRGGEPVEIVILTALAFLLPAVVLSAVTPVVVKLQLADLARTGTVVGRYSAVGTAGAIFGTFFTGFVLVAAFPTRPVVFGVGAALVAGGLALTVRWRGVGTVTAAVVVAATLLGGGALALVDGPCDTETTYYCARVEIDEQRSSGRTLWLDTVRHSYVDLEDPLHLEFRYMRLFADLAATQTGAGPVDALYIGGGGFTLPRWLAAARPGSTSTVLEIDGGLVDLAERKLGLDGDEIGRLLIGDARLTLATLPAASYDLIVGDAFGGFSVPWHLTTEEFITDIETRLAPGGIYIMNVLDRPPNAFAQAEAATLRRVFAHVAVVAPPELLDGADGGNFVLAGSQHRIDAEALMDVLEARSADSRVIMDQAVEAWADGAPVLRDDFAPVDQLLGDR
ncbi:MAG: fused MFS/spermidine synthase [Acidimicrobiia bacterium]|nr:fused MFS/spermidine synthase [Acidimicrobiia bacterium]